jgi:hypothetical protein
VTRPLLTHSAHTHSSPGRMHHTNACPRLSSATNPSQHTCSALDKDPQGIRHAVLGSPLSRSPMEWEQPPLGSAALKLLFPGRTNYESPGSLQKAILSAPGRRDLTHVCVCVGWGAMGFRLRTLHLLGRCSTIELRLQSSYASVLFQIWSPAFAQAVFRARSFCLHLLSS